MINWTRVMGRFHKSEIADLLDDPKYKVVKTEKKAEPFPGSPPEDFDDHTLYELYERG